MPEIIEVDDVGGLDVPHDIRRARKNVLDVHTRMGTPLIFKRRRTLDDVEKGNAVICPYDTDEQYQSSRSNCPYCFGTNILGGFDDGIVTFVILGDTATDIFQLTEQGVFTRLTNPRASAPWQPLMGDGDMLVIAEFDPESYEVTATKDRFVLKQTNPVMPRGAAPVGFTERREKGWFNNISNENMLISQIFQIDRLPDGHIFYQVPIDEPGSYPDPPDNPLGHDPIDPSPSTPYVVYETTEGDASITFPAEYE